MWVGGCKVDGLHFTVSFLDIVFLLFRAHQEAEEGAVVGACQDISRSGLSCKNQPDGVHHQGKKCSGGNQQRDVLVDVRYITLISDTHPLYNDAKLLIKKKARIR